MEVFRHAGESQFPAFWHRLSEIGIEWRPQGRKAAVRTREDAGLCAAVAVELAPEATT